MASRFLAVGALVPAAQAGVGALATQALANLTYRANGLRLLAEGTAAAAVVAALTGGDEQRDDRQLGVVDTRGQGATFTGTQTMPWAGGRAGRGYAIQGNILTGPDVVAAMEQSWLDGAGPLPRRLLSALIAGDREGGDARGRQSAALLVVRAGSGYGMGHDVLVDLRVDDHPDPVGELARLLDLHELLFTPGDPRTALPLAEPLLAELRELLAAVGHPAEDGSAPAVEKALERWAGWANFELRLLPGAVDRELLEQLRAAARQAAAPR